jgi:Protein of unknown function (DUF3179)
MSPLRLPALLLPLVLASCAGSVPATTPGAAPPRAGAPPPLDHAPLVREKAAASMKTGDLVFGVELGGDARAYPLRILDWHTVANDTIDRIPVALAYCRPCGSVALYRTDTPRGTLTLAASGRFRDGDQLLVDRQTGTLWRQLTGTPVEGPLAGSGIELRPLPVVLTTWTRWFQSHLDSRVLALETGFQHEYAPEAAPSPAGSPVFGVVLGGAAKAYPVELVAKLGVIDDELGGRPIVIVAEPGADPGNRTIRVYDRGDRVFARSGHAFLGASFINDQNGRPWKIGEEALATPDGQKRPRLPGKLTDQAGWAAAYPQAQVYREATPP